MSFQSAVRKGNNGTEAGIKFQGGKVMRINHNIAALNTYRQLTGVNNATAKSLEKLSSGYRINKAADDAAGLAISEKMRGQIRGLEQAMRNAQDGISLIQTAEGALNETHSILQRMRELAVQAANDSNTNADRMEVQKEINQLASEVTRISNNTEFNTMTLLDGTYSGTFHIGANEDQVMSLEIGDMRASSLDVVATAADWSFDAGATNLTTSTSDAGALAGGIYTVEVAASGAVTVYANDGTEIGSAALADSGTTVTVTISGAAYLAGTATDITIAISDTDTAGTVATEAGTITMNVLEAGEGISVLSQDDAESAITDIQEALNRVSNQRSNLGAVQNRLEHTINNLGTAEENLTAAESRVRDVDMAREMMEFTKNNIISQAATAMLAQANMQPQQVLQLLQ